MQYIHVWRRSPTARYLDVQLAEGKIAVFPGDHAPDMPKIETEAELVAFVNDTTTDSRAVPVDLARTVLGWTIP